MSSVIVRPTAVASDATIWANNGGAATKAAALGDELDTTYLSSTAVGGSAANYLIFTMGPAGLPDGAAIVSLVPQVRMARSSSFNGTNPITTLIRALGKVASFDIATSAQFPISSIPFSASYTPVSDLTLATAGSYNDPGSANAYTAQEVAQSLQFGFNDYVDNAGVGLRMYRAQLTVNYVQAPSASTLAVAGVTTTTKPKLTYTYVSPDSVAQYEMQAAAWTVADATAYPGGLTAFEASPEIAFTDAAGVGAPSFINGGTTYSAKGWTRNPDSGLPGWARPSVVGEWTPDQALPVAASMKTYLRVAGTYAGNRLWRRTAAGVSTVTYTMAVTPPVAPTSIAATYVADPDYRSVVSVVMPVDSTSRRVFVERSVNGRNWYLLPQGLKTITGSAQTVVFYDTAYAPNNYTNYRVRVAHPTLEVYGAYVTLGTGIYPTPNAFVLRDPLDLETVPPVVLRWQGDMEASMDEILGESRGLGTGLPVFVSDAIGGRRWQVEIILTDETTYAALTLLRARRATMSFETDMGGIWAWVRFGAGWSETVLRTTGRRLAFSRSRRIRFELVETYPIPGQPTPSELATGS